MSGLLKADFRRVLKDKLILIMCIIAAAFAVITPLLYVMIFAFSGDTIDDSDMAMDMLNGLFSAKTQFFASFSIGNNFGLVAPILLAIVLCKDFSYGTIRNKIISGKSRSSIFLSLFTTCSAVYVGVMFIHAFLTLGVSLIFFDYQSTEFTFADFRYFVVSLVFEVLNLLFVSALLSWLCANMKNAGIAIVLYVAVALGLVMAGSIVQVALGALTAMNANETLISVLEFIDKINIGTASAYIGTGSSYTPEDVIYHTVTPIIGTAGFLTLGLVKFNKRDLK